MINDTQGQCYMFALVEIEGKGKLTQYLKIKDGPSQREAVISYVLELYDFEKQR